MVNRPKPILLVVHNDDVVLRQIAKMTSEVAEVVVARSSMRASAVAQSTVEFNVALVGRANDNVSAIDILNNLHTRRPQVRTILLGDVADLSSSIQALHGGLADHVINPPLRERELLAILALPSPKPIPVAHVIVAPQVTRTV